MSGFTKIWLEGHKGWDFMAHLAEMGLKGCGKENGGTGETMGKISSFCVKLQTLLFVPASRNVDDILLKELN